MLATNVYKSNLTELINHRPLLWSSVLNFMEVQFIFGFAIEENECSIKLSWFWIFECFFFALNFALCTDGLQFLNKLNKYNKRAQSIMMKADRFIKKKKNSPELHLLVHYSDYYIIAAPHSKPKEDAKHLTLTFSPFFSNNLSFACLLNLSRSFISFTYRISDSVSFIFHIR